MMKLNFKQKLFLYFALTFTLFTVGVVIFEQFRDKNFKTEALEDRLDIYAEMVHDFLNENHNDYKKLDEILLLFPDNIRLSIIESSGTILYDNSIKDLSTLGNHSDRNEIAIAVKNGKGTDIRISSTTDLEYLYYAKNYNAYYVRVALPYDIQIRKFLKADNAFLYFIIGFFLIMLFLMNIISNSIGKSIKQLRDFALSSDNEVANLYTFPKDELGEIGAKITENYKKLNESQKEVLLEREKLLQHIHISEEGICFFSPDKNVVLYNSLFIQFLNILLDEPTSEPTDIFKTEIFKEIQSFLNENKSKYYETKLSKQGRIFSVRINLFEDEGFEVVLNDITKLEKTKLLKQQMTSNIAHELRTPLTGVRAYLETVLEQDIDEKKRRYFLKQAFNQTVILSDIVKEMGMIIKMEEAKDSFALEEVNLNQLLKTLKRDLSFSLNEQEIDLQWDISKDTRINGNRYLLYSIFRNLIDNSISYAGKGILIRINLYKEDEDSYYFSYYDTGTGISNESHLIRIFERFYRINEGRTRDTGGTGLGLSIVKNAISFHKGSIIAKNRKESGLEFIFNLHK